MAVTYGWSIRELSYEIGPDSEGHSDIVNSVDWLLTASDDEDPPHEALWAGVQKLTWEDGDPWIDYSDLTQSDCVGWVQAKLGNDEIASMEAKLDAQIAEKETPTKGSAGSGDLPWDEGDGA